MADMTGFLSLLGGVGAGLDENRQRKQQADALAFERARLATADAQNAAKFTAWQQDRATDQSQQNDANALWTDFAPSQPSPALPSPTAPGTGMPSFTASSMRPGAAPTPAATGAVPGMATGQASPQGLDWFNANLPALMKHANNPYVAPVLDKMLAMHRALKEEAASTLSPSLAARYNSFYQTDVFQPGMSLTEAQENEGILQQQHAHTADAALAQYLTPPMVPGTPAIPAQPMQGTPAMPAQVQGQPLAPWLNPNPAGPPSANMQPSRPPSADFKPPTAAMPAGPMVQGDAPEMTPDAVLMIVAQNGGVWTDALKTAYKSALDKPTLVPVTPPGGGESILLKPTDAARMIQAWKPPTVKAILPSQLAVEYAGPAQSWVGTNMSKWSSQAETKLRGFLPKYLEKQIPDDPKDPEGVALKRMAVEADVNKEITAKRTDAEKQQHQAEQTALAKDRLAISRQSQSMRSAMQGAAEHFRALNYQLAVNRFDEGLHRDSLGALKTLKTQQSNLQKYRNSLVNNPKNQTEDENFEPTGQLRPDIQTEVDGIDHDLRDVDSQIANAVVLPMVGGAPAPTAPVSHPAAPTHPTGGAPKGGGNQGISIPPEKISAWRKQYGDAKTRAFLKQKGVAATF